MDVNILLFNDFESLDIFGPVEILGQIEEYQLRYFSVNGGIITSRQNTKIMTEKLFDTNFPEILVIPGGQGTRPLVNDTIFIEEIKRMAIKSQYCLTICTGSALLCKTGLLNGRRATSNKRAFEWVKSLNPDVLWQSHARWTCDDKFYTSSGVSAGMDMALGFVADKMGKERAIEISQSIEYIWNSNESNDPFES